MYYFANLLLEVIAPHYDFLRCERVKHLLYYLEGASDHHVGVDDKNTIRTSAEIRLRGTKHMLKRAHGNLGHSESVQINNHIPSFGASWHSALLDKVGK